MLVIFSSKSWIHKVVHIVNCLFGQNYTGLQTDIWINIP